jgi:hypothetical protein
LRAQYAQRKREIEEQQEIEAEIAEMNAALDVEQTESEVL